MSLWISALAYLNLVGPKGFIVVVSAQVRAYISLREIVHVFPHFYFLLFYLEDFLEEF